MVSRAIDESLQEDKKLIKKHRKATKVLLLGKLITFATHPHLYSSCLKVKLSPERVRCSRVSAHTLSVVCPSFSYNRHGRL